ncbi:acyltransferase family protein [Pseudoduganella sp.]|uniref:acyltransferase family protein n=1 Tax=Pseudoduganella sp. TaxID=1880898 RepID=UPI0035B45A59
MPSYISAPPAAPAYYPHIDGLRALAVVAVVVFHTFPQALPGGFAGVDIFFVISGYLITGILLRALDAGSFSLASFYARRVRRIFPALLVVMAATLVLGWLLMLPEELSQLGRHAAGGAGFVANFLFWHESGYFDNSAETKPFLHLWSLGVEEQFYIAWPLLLCLLSRWRRAFVPVTLLLALASFGYSVYAALHAPDAAFYSPASRFWELAVGGLLAWWHTYHPPRTTPAPVWTLAAAIAIASAFRLIDKTSLFPGYWALLPVAGTTVLLAAGPAATLNASLFRLAPVTWLGRISYPLYLWHWPLLSFAHILQGGNVAEAVLWSALALSVLLAWLTCVVVEGRLRFAMQGKPALPVALAALLCALGGFGFQLYRMDGVPQRELLSLSRYLPMAATAPSVAATAPAPVAAVLPAAVPVALTQAAILPDTPATALALQRLRAMRAADYHYVGRLQLERNRIERYHSCHLMDIESAPSSFADYYAGHADCITLAPQRRNVLVYGDSAAAELHAALVRAYPDVNFLQITGSACKPFQAAYRNKEHYCVRQLAYAQQFAASHKLDGVVVASAWQDDFRVAREDLQRFRAAGHPVLLAGPPLTFSDNLAMAMLRLDRKQSLAAIAQNMLEPSALKHADAMHAFALENRFGYLNRLQLYCEGGCPLISPKGVPLILDHFHLSPQGVELLADRIRSSQVLEHQLWLGQGG